MNHLSRVLRTVWWRPILALTALFLGRLFPLNRAYGLVFAHHWIVVYNGDFSRLSLAPRRRAG